MLCFIHGFNENEEQTSSNSRNFRSKLLKKTRSTNFQTKMVITNRSFHCRTQSATMVPTNSSSSNSNSINSTIENSGNSRNNKKTLTVSASSVSLLQMSRSPSHQQQQQHSVFSKIDKASLKFLSTSSPAMTAPLSLPTTTPINSDKQKDEKRPSTSKSRQKKFHRHFPTVDEEEKVLNYYSCALIGDILLQGHLYITKNYFAFYSNVFGYVTKLLIPMPSVEKITKEKTAKIIPNAVGISTQDDKHVFGSLMSRDNTFKFMTEIWELSQNEKLEEEILGNGHETVVELRPETLILATNNSELSDYSSETKDVESEKEESSTNGDKNAIFLRKCGDKLILKEELTDSKLRWKSLFMLRQKFLKGYKAFLNLPSHTLVLFAATFLLLLLFLSAIMLIYRINRIQDKYVSVLEDHNVEEDIQSQLLRFSMNLHAKSANSVYNFVDTNLQQIVKIREDLETLSSILFSKNDQNAKGKS